MFLTEIKEKHDVSETVFLVDRVQSLQTACRRMGYDFRYKQYKNWYAVERIFNNIKRELYVYRTVSATLQQRLPTTGSDRSALHEISLSEHYQTDSA